MNRNLALAFIGFMFFSCGFALGLNPFLIPILKQSLHIDSLTSYLVMFFSFMPFILWGYPSQVCIKKVGYRKSIALSFVLFALSFICYDRAAQQMSIMLFLAASFISGSANTLLQACINPYVTFLGPIDSAAKRISIMGICNKLAWPFPSLFLVWLMGKEIQYFGIEDLSTPFHFLIGVCAALAIICRFIPLQEMDVDNQQNESKDKVASKPSTSLADYPHLYLGALALFLYVGVETVSLATAVDYATKLGLPHAEGYSVFAPIGMVIGYVCGAIMIPKYMSQALALRICSAIAIIGSILVPLLPGAWSVYCLLFLALGCSLMWPAIWPLATCDLGDYTSKGNSLLTMAIAGGAVVPTLFGWLSDISAQGAYWICLPCFLFILYYGTTGYKIRK